MAKVRIILVASGSGTDANAVMERPPKNGEIVCLLSTAEEAGCLEKARVHNVPTWVIPRKDKNQARFFREIGDLYQAERVQLVFLLGCIHLMPVIPGITMYNIHPADPVKHGGRGMYGLETHLHVLNELVDRIVRGAADPKDRFFTYPTIHEVNGEYDKGAIFMQAAVEIPQTIVFEFLRWKTDADGKVEEIVKKLQKHVLAYEHLMLPAAVEMACHKFLSAS